MVPKGDKADKQYHYTTSILIHPSWPTKISY